MSAPDHEPHRSRRFLLLLKGRPHMSQSFSDQCASCARRQYGLTFGCRLRFQTIAFLPLVTSIQVRQSATPLQIVRGKTLRHVWTPLEEQEKSSRAVWLVVGC